MTRAQLDSIEGIIVKLANGVAVFYPPVAPIAAAIKELVGVAEAHGIIPTEVPEAQLREIAAHMAAHAASVLASERAHRK